MEMAKVTSHVDRVNQALRGSRTRSAVYSDYNSADGQSVRAYLTNCQDPVKFLYDDFAGTQQLYRMYPVRELVRRTLPVLRRMFHNMADQPAHHSLLDDRSDAPGVVGLTAYLPIQEITDEYQKVIKRAFVAATEGVGCHSFQDLFDAGIYHYPTCTSDLRTVESRAVPKSQTQRTISGHTPSDILAGRVFSNAAASSGPKSAGPPPTRAVPDPKPAKPPPVSLNLDSTGLEVRSATMTIAKPKGPPPATPLVPGTGSGSSSSHDMLRAKAEMLGEARSKSGFVSLVSPRAMIDVAPVSPTRVVRPDVGPLPGLPHPNRSPLPTVRTAPKPYVPGVHGAVVTRPPPPPLPVAPVVVGPMVPPPDYAVAGKAVPGKAMPIYGPKPPPLVVAPKPPPQEALGLPRFVMQGGNAPVYEAPYHSPEEHSNA